MAAVSGGVKDSVESVSEGVREALDLRKHVREHPLPMLGGAAVLGLIAGWLVFRRNSTGTPAQTASPMHFPVQAMAAPTLAAQRPAWLNDLFDLAGRELKKLAEHAITRVTSSVQKGVEEGIPKMIDRAMPDVATVGFTKGMVPSHSVSFNCRRIFSMQSF